MSLAADLRAVLSHAAGALPFDTAAMAASAEAMIGAHIDAGRGAGIEADALSFVDHLFRGSAAAGALQTLPPLPEPVPAAAPVKPASAPVPAAAKPAAPAPAPAVAPAAPAAVKPA